MAGYKPRETEIVVQTVKALRANSDVVQPLYVDSEVPSTESERKRIYAGDPARANDAGCELAVHTVTSAGTHNGRTVEETLMVQFSPIATESWYERYGYLQLTQIKDAIVARLESPIRESVYPRGPAGSAETLTIQDDTGRRMRPFSWNMSTHWTTKAGLSQ
jgi:hypothetical protein